MSILHLAKRLFQLLERSEQRFDELKINQGKILSQLARSVQSTNLQDYEFKVFSQWGEDGIIQRLVNNIPIANKTFIEFGVEDFFESNCRFLMVNNNWRGFVMDGSEAYIERLRSSHFYWKYDLQALSAFVTSENVNTLLRKSGFDSDLGILSIDLDGIDYWILDAVAYFQPRILILEYNAVFGSERAISVSYDKTFIRSQKHSSNLYWGASLPALSHAASKKGYVLVGTNSAGCNAFFVRSDLVNEKVPAAPHSFTESRYRESRENGALTYLSGSARAEAIRGMPVVNVMTGQTEAF